MRFGVEILSLPFRFECGDAAFVAEARRRYRPFLANRGPVWRVTVSPRMLDPRGGVVPRVDGPRVRRRDFEADLSRREVLVHRVPSAFDSFLRVLVSLRLRDGVLVHSAAADGRLLPGKSGAGKSTFGAKLGARAILSDELTGLVRRRGRWWVGGTPFWGNFTAGRVNRLAPLEAICFLDRRAPRGLRPVAPAEALIRLLECVLCFRDDDETATRVLRLCAAAVRAVPCVTLSYDAATTGPGELRRLLRSGG